VEGTNPEPLVLLEQVRAELTDLEGRVVALRTLLDGALEYESGGTRRRAARIGSETDPRRVAAARSVASHMSLSGYARWSAQDRLRGSVTPDELRAILDEVYGPPKAAHEA
jgi:hypothetical protein